MYGGENVKAILNRPLMALCILWLTVLAGSFGLMQILPECGCMLLTVVTAAGVLLTAFFYCLRSRAERGKKRKTAVFFLLCAVVILCSFFRAQGVQKRVLLWKSLQGETVSITGKVEQLSYVTEYSAGMRVRIDTVNGEKLSCKLLLNAEVPVYAETGERLSCTALVEIPDWEREDTVYNFSKGIFGELTLREDDAFLLLEPENRGFSAFCQELALTCKIRARQYLSARDAGVLCGILLGDKSDLPADAKRDFRRVGISHILAVSGLHVSILLGAAELVLLRLKMPKKLRLLLMALFLLCFMGTAGFPLSLVRAGIMWMMTAAAFFLGGTNDSLTALFLSAAGITVVSPQAVFDVGLLLSVSATLGILVLGLPTVTWFRNRLSGKKKKLLLPVLSLPVISVTATMFTFPVSALVFGEISLLGPLANQLIQLPLSGILFLGPVLLLFAGLPFSFPAKVTAAALRLLISLTLWIVRNLAAIPSVLIGVRYPFLLPVMALFILVSVFFLWKYRKVFCLYLSFLICIIAFGGCLFCYRVCNADRIWMDCMVSGKNDCIAVLTCDRAMLIDNSDGSHGCAYKAWMMLSGDNMTEIDTLLLTHYHNKHIATLARLSEETVIRKLVLPEPETEEEALFLSGILDTGVFSEEQISFYRRGGEEIAFGNAVLSFFPREMLSRSTQPLTAYRITANDGSFLYLGAAVWESTDEAYETIRKQAENESDCLYLGIHGPNIHAPFVCPEKEYRFCIAAKDALLPYLPANAVSLEQTKHLFFSLSSQ